MSNALAQAARAGFRPVGGNSMVQYGTAKQQGGECCSQIVQLSDKNFTLSWLPVVWKTITFKLNHLRQMMFTPGCNIMSNNHNLPRHLSTFRIESVEHGTTSISVPYLVINMLDLLSRRSGQCTWIAVMGDGTNSPIVWEWPLTSFSFAKSKYISAYGPTSYNYHR